MGTPINESDLLEHIRLRSGGIARAFSQIVVGPGDDCAVVRTPGGDEVLLTTDQLVEGRHYERGTPIDLVARKAVARSVSDIAAMGGTPSWALATACLPRRFARADELFEAMHRWASHWGCPLVGGDIATFGDDASPLVLTVTIGGVMGARWIEAWVDLPHGAGDRTERAPRPVTRAGARPGDAVLVTGTLGDTLSTGKHLSFEPRLREGELCAWLGARAMIDVSDGLGRDAARIARASGVVIEIEAARLPLATATTTWERAVRDGEDYELLMICEHLTPLDVVRDLTRIGAVRACEPGEAPGVWVTDAYGRRYEVSDWGWDHR